MESQFLFKDSASEESQLSSFMVYESNIMKETVAKAKQISQFPTTVLIEGDSGTGKELMAELIHFSSPRAKQKFIKINCASFPESLVDAEFFGYEKGAFTGASDMGKTGLFEQADGGTILLDEVGELPMSSQAKLLRVIQDKQIRRIGGSITKALDVRIISSTNKSLLNEVNKGTFRLDLYYRLSVVNFYLVPLCQRRDDINVLVDHFFKLFCDKYGLVRIMDDRVKEMLYHYSWPGNVRQLMNAMESIVIECTREKVKTSDLPTAIRNQDIETGQKSGNTEKSDGNGLADKSLEEQLANVEAEIIIKTIENTKSLRTAAEKLGVSHTTLIRKAEKYGIKKK